MMKKKHVKMWVIPEFKDLIKSEASIKGFSTCVGFQEDILRKRKPISEIFELSKRRKNKNDFFY